MLGLRQAFSVLKLVIPVPAAEEKNRGSLTTAWTCSCRATAYTS